MPEMTRARRAQSGSHAAFNALVQNIGSVCLSSAFAVGGVHIGRHIGNDAIVLPPFDDFQIYVVYGVASIFLIRALLTIYGPRLTLRR